MSKAEKELSIAQVHVMENLRVLQGKIGEAIRLVLEGDNFRAQRLLLEAVDKDFYNSISALDFCQDVHAGRKAQHEQSILYASGDRERVFKLERDWEAYDSPELNALREFLSRPAGQVVKG